MAKERTIVCPAEYIDKDGNVVRTITTARNEDEEVFVIYRNPNYENKIILKSHFFERFDIALDGKKLETKETEPDEDVMKAFQEQALGR